MEFLYSNFDLFTSSLFSMNWQDGAGALCLLILSSVVIYSGFPAAFALVGVATLLSFYALVSGGIGGSAFTPFAAILEKLLTSETLLALPLFLFSAIIIERAFITENLIKNFINHWRQKSEAMLFTVSLVDIIVSGLAAIICALFAPLAALRMPLLLKTENHQLLNSDRITSLFSKGPLLNPKFIPITVMLILVAELFSTASISSIDLAKNQSVAPGVQIASYTPTDFFIAALVPGFLFTFLYCLYQLFLMFKYPSEYVFKNIEKERDDTPSSKAELIKSLCAPGVYAAIVLSALLIFKLPIVEVAAIAAIGSIFLASHHLAPEKNNIYLNTVISFLCLFFLSKMFALDVNKFESSQNIGPLNVAVFAISIFFVGYIAYGIYNAVTPLMKSGTVKQERATHSFMSEILMETFEHASKIITLLIAALLYILIFKQLGGDQLLKLFYENFRGNDAFAILASILILLLVGKAFTPIIALLIAVPILLPQLLLFAKTNGVEINMVWFGVLIIIALQTLGFYSFSINEMEKNVDSERSLEVLKPQIFQTKIPLIIFQILILTLCWLFPQLVLSLGTVI